MRRSGFKSKSPGLEPRDPDRTRPTPTVAAGSFMAPLPVEGGLGVPKTPPVRDKAYLRRVAQLPCANCGVSGYSQAAHSNSAGKGMGMKSSDHATFPLCCTRLGVPGCHVGLDSGAMFDKETRRLKEAEWVAQTQLILGLQSTVGRA